MKINSEMNLKYSTYDHLDKLQCIEDENILNLEKKFDPFSIDKNYNYELLYRHILLFRWLQLL